MRNLPSVMSHKFSEVPQAKIPRSTFDRSHGYKTTFDGGYLVPIFIDEALPGDTFNCNMTALARLATPLHPIMDNIFLSSFFFAVPMRLLWTNWEKFNGEQTDPGDSIDFTIPTMPSTAVTGYLEGSLHDYFGIPTEIPDLDHSSMWHRAYNLIYNEWFRDENLINSVVVDTDNGPDDPADYVLLRRGKRHDYFTSALPWPQKGDAVDIPLSGTAPITGLGVLSAATILTGPSSDVKETGTNPVNYDFYTKTDSQTFWMDFDGSGVGGEPQVFADLTQATAATINQLRQAFQIQKILERDARGGTRYTEMIKSHFGVTSPDARLQRPEYLGGGQSPVTISPIAQQSSTDATTPQGNLAGFGVATMSGHGFTKSFTEHCVIIGLISARADLNYQQGLPRMFSRSTRYDFYLPALAQIGEQSILNKEIYAQGSGDPTADAAVFGYQERFAEYRYKPSVITGQFRSNFAQTLDTWHLAQDFSSLPTLNATFINDTPPLDRIIATANEPHFLLDTYFKLRCARPMPVYGVPGMIDHF